MGRHSSQVGEHPFVVRDNAEVARGVWRMVAETPVAARIAPGQFVNLTVPGDASERLRIPLSFARADAGRGFLTLEYAVVGPGTRRLSAMETGEASRLTGPCGSGWRLPETAGEEKALLVAGGIGLPPVVAAAGMLAEAGVRFDAVVGARTAALLLADELDRLRTMPAGIDCDRQVVVATDDGTAGVHGFTTGPVGELLAERPYSCVYACGPNPMLAGVARLAEAAGVPCQVSLERMMGCGFGACACCNVALADGGYALCCQDGPVFDAREVAWDRL